MEIRKQFGTVEIAQVRSLPKVRRNELLMNMKDINGLSMRKAARILEVSVKL
jgi:putative transposase